MPISRKPACAIDEYASSRFMLVWVSAATLPSVMVRTETSIRSAGQSIPPERSHGPCPGDGQRAVEEAQRDREPGRLRQHRQERRHRGRGALVHVGAPEVERHRRDLEAESGQRQERRRVHGEAIGVGNAAGEVLLEPRQRRGPREAVEDREPVEHRARRGRAEQDVLERGLVRHPVALQVRHHHVRGERDHLEREVQHHQVVRGGEQQAREHEREHERVELALA